MKLIITFLLCFLIVSCHQKKEKETNSHLNEVNILNETKKNESIEIDTLLNSNNYLIIAPKSATIKIIKQHEISNFQTFKILMNYKDDIIIGENISEEDVEIYRKYHPKTSFNDYPATIYKGKLADPDFSSNPTAKQFITRIKEGCKNGINFAGHFTLIYWGCGSSCQMGVLVDRKTGKIYDGYQTSYGSKFEKNSKLIIKNAGAIDTNTNLILMCASCEVYEEIWTGTKFKLIE